MLWIVILAVLFYWLWAAVSVFSMKDEEVEKLLRKQGHKNNLDKDQTSIDEN